jgi:hypothetical protein
MSRAPQRRRLSLRTRILPDASEPFLTKEPKLLLNDNDAGKPEGIHLMIGRRPCAAFGNSTGDRQGWSTPERGMAHG